MKHMLWMIGLLLGLGAATLAYGQGGAIQPDGQNAQSFQVNCTTTATLALAANTRRRSFGLTTVQATQVVWVCLGNPSCTIATGIPLQPNGAINDNSFLGTIHCIVASGTQNMAVGETSR